MLVGSRVLGATTPRLFTPPLVKGLPGPCGCGCALTPATSKGFSAVAFAADVLGISLLPWQRWLLIHAFELRPDGGFRFRTILVMVARQNGKTTTIEVKNLWKMFVLQVPLIIATAHDLTASEETWEHALEMVEGVPDLASEIKHVDKTNGKKSLRLTNGSRWLVKAASRKAGRSFSADDINLDELREHLTWLSWSAVTKTMMARPKAQNWCCSNAGDVRSVVLNSLQKKARAADPEGSLFLAEWSAPDDTRCTCDRADDDTPHGARCMLRDRKLWAMANPALGYTITEDAMLSALDTDPEEVFLTECLCVKVVNLSGGILSANRWAAREDAKSTAVGPVAVAVDASPDLESAAIGMAGVREDGKRHWQVLRHDPGSNWVVEQLQKLRDDGLVFGAVGLDSSGPAGALIEDLRGAGFEVCDVTGKSLVQAWGAFAKAVKDDDGHHIGQFTLDQAIRDAKNAPSGDVEKFSRKGSAGDISPIVAVTIADHVQRTVPPKQEGPPLVAWR